MALAKMTWDELNQLVGYNISEPFDEYYAPMKLTEKQKRQRMALAERLDDVFIALLAEFFYADQIGAIVSSDIYERTRESYMDAVRQSVEPDYYILNHGIELIATTIAVLMRHQDEPYFYSEDRARAIAEGDSNSVWNHTEYENAVKNKHYKTWNTIMDGKERDSHAEVNGLTIPIDDLFHLQGGDCLYPRDDSYGMSDEEIISCRCSLTFS